MKEKKLNILMFNRWVGYNQGGNETHIKELAMFLSRKGHSVSLLTTGTKAIKEIRPNLKAVYNVSSSKSYYSLGKNRILAFAESMFFLFRSFLVISKLVLIDKKRIDILSVHFSLEAFLARFVRFFYGIPYILVLVGDTDFELLEGKYADKTVQISKFMADECKPFGYKPIVLTKGVDRKRFNVKVSRAERNNYLNSPEKEKLVVTVCRLDPRKNLETLVKAAEITSKTNPEINYLIVGGGTDEKKLKSLIEEKNLKNTITMAGAISSSSPLLPRLYRAGDLFVLPTLYEGFGYVFSEAMACGLPIISTRTSAVPEVVDGVGILVPLRDPEKLAKEIIKVTSSASLQNKMSKAGLERVEQWYWDRLIDKYEEAYYDCVYKRINIGDRWRVFLLSFLSIGFLFKKTLGFIFSPQLLKWGPTKSK